MAAVVILYDAGSHTQRHYFGHTDDIISVAAHPGGTVAASGEVGNYSPIRVWSTETLETFHVLDGHRKGVNALDFLADERLLASVSADDQRTVRRGCCCSKGERVRLWGCWAESLVLIDDG